MNMALSSATKLDWVISNSGVRSERRHLPPTARPHVAWTKELSECYSNIDDGHDDNNNSGYDNTKHNIYYNNNTRENEDDYLASEYNYSTRDKVTLTQLLTVDGCNATSLMLYTKLPDLSINHSQMESAESENNKKEHNLTNACVGKYGTSNQTSRNHIDSSTTIIHTWQSKTIPSCRKITHVLFNNANNTLTDLNNSQLTDTQSELLSFYVSDDIGNIYRFNCMQPSSSIYSIANRHSCATCKRPRVEQTDGNLLELSATNEHAQWERIATSHCVLPSSNACSLPNTSTSTEASSFASSEELFNTSYGAPGWSGLALVQDSCHDTLLINAREFFSDVRIIDVNTEQVIQVYGTTHSPTGLHSLSTSSPQSKVCSSGPFANCVLVSEGCLATLYDVRCQTSVLTLHDLKKLTEDYTNVQIKENKEGNTWSNNEINDASSDKCNDRSHHSKETEAICRANDKGNKNVSNSSNNRCSLIPGRLTSVNGVISDVCGTRNEFEVALSIDRALCVYDYRKFTRQFTSSSVLKYEIASIASYESGNGVVCAGIDAEVHTIQLYPALMATTTTIKNTAMRTSTKSTDVITSGHTLTTKAIKEQSEKQQKSSSNKEVNCVSKIKMSEENRSEGNEGVKGSFRTRINTSAYCERTWHGGWVTAVTNNGKAAIGISSTGELFMTT